MLTAPQVAGTSVRGDSQQFAVAARRLAQLPNFCFIRGEIPGPNRRGGQPFVVKFLY
jgi:hypothetical protein